MDDGKILYSKSRLYRPAFRVNQQKWHLLLCEIWHYPARLTPFTKQGQLIGKTVFPQTSFVLATDQQYLLRSTVSLQFNISWHTTRLSVIFLIQAQAFSLGHNGFIFCLWKIKNDQFVHNWRQFFQKRSSSASWC